MKKIICFVLFTIIAIGVCACGDAEKGNEASLTVDAGSIEFTIPSEYVYSQEDSDEDVAIYYAANNDGDVIKAFFVTSLDAVDDIDANLNEIEKQAKKYAMELDGSEEGGIKDFHIEKSEIIEEGYPMVVCTCKNSDQEYLKDYFYFFEDCTGLILEINLEENDLSDIDTVMNHAYFNLEERFSEDDEPTTEETTTEASTEEATTSTSNGLGTEVTDSKKKSDVWICAQDVVTQDLKSPATAKFCKVYEATVYHQTGNQYIAMGYVDSENSYGALIRTYFTVWLTMTKNGYKDAHAEYDQ